MAASSSDVLEAVRRLLEEPQFQDVTFLCDDGTVASNRAFLAARNEYMEMLLFGGLKEGGEATIRLHASSQSFRHILTHLHTGHFDSLDAEACAIILMEASSLAQQYMLPALVQHVADRLSADLSKDNLGLALSYALKNDLQAVTKSIWIALPRLLSRPFALDRSFSADAICFCLQHTAWMSPPAAAAAAGSPTSGAAAGAAAATSAASTAAAAAAAAPAPAAGALAGEASGTAIHRASSINGASMGSSSLTALPHGLEGGAAAGAAGSRGALYSPGSRADSAVAQEALAFSAVLDWMLQEVAGCADCMASRQVCCGSSSRHADRGSGAHALSRPVSCATTPRGAAVVDPAAFGHIVQASPGKNNDGSSMQACSGGGAAPAAGSSSLAGASGAAEVPAIERSSSMSPLAGESSQPLHPAMQGSRQQLHQQQQQQQSGAAAAPSPATGVSQRGLVGRLSSHSVRSSYESDTTEGEQDIRSLRSVGAASAGSSSLPPLSAFAGSSARISISNLAQSAAAAGDSAAAASAGLPPLCPPPAAPDAAAAADSNSAPKQQQQEQQVVYTGCCCVGHQGMLLQMLAHLNWHLLEPRLLEKLDSLALLGPAALLEIYRAHQRCCHMAQWGNFPSLSLGGERGLRCYVTGGEQLLECESVSHLTATSNLCFTSGRHCWQFVVAVPCDLVWLGVSDGTLQPDVWGGKQPGGWFYGSNDALCHNKQSDRHAYTKHCGNGKWGDAAVVDVCLDMDAREVWFGVDGGEPKLGFTGLPDRVFPAVSLRAPAQLLVRFRAASWLISE